MPIYTYMCRECNILSDVEKSMLDPHPERCPACGKTGLYQKLYPPAIIFHGSGFYSTDKTFNDITDPEYQLTHEEQIEYYDEKLRHGDDRKIKVFT